MKTYKGTPPVTADGRSEKAGSYLVEVVVGDASTGDAGRYVLPPRNDLFNHSPDGFQWGYGGSGPAQLALAILADYFGSDGRARALYQQFKWDVVARLPSGEPWELHAAEIAEAVAHIESGAP